METQNITIKDIYNRNVFVGQQVGVLVKEYGYRKITGANIIKATYIGKGQYGFQFKTGYGVLNIREPIVMKK